MLQVGRVIRSLSSCHVEIFTLSFLQPELFELFSKILSRAPVRRGPPAALASEVMLVLAATDLTMVSRLE